MRSPFRPLVRAREAATRLARAGAASAAARLRQRREQVERADSALASWQHAVAAGGPGLSPMGWRALAADAAALHREAECAEVAWRTARDVAVEARAALAVAERLEARWCAERLRALSRAEQSALDDLAAARWWLEGRRDH